MLTPFEVDLLRQDLQAALKLLGQDEIDAAHELLREQGLRPEDFQIVRHLDPSPTFPGATDRVTLLRKSTHMAKTYEAGQDTSWLERFESDLKSGAFGPL